METVSERVDAGGRRAKVAAAILAVVAAGVLLVVTAEPEPSMMRKLFGLWRGRALLLPVALLLAAGGVLAAACSRQAMLKYLSTCVGAAFALLVLEAAGQAGLVSWPDLLSPKASVAPIGSTPVPNMKIRGVTRHDLASAWGLPSPSIEYEYVTDRHGFRNRQDREAAHVYVLGDSIVLGALVAADQTVAGALERRLGVPTMQVALIDKSPQEIQRLFKQARLDVRGRLVLQFVFEGNDLPDSRRFRVGGAGTEAVTSRWQRSMTQNLIVAAQRWTQPVHGAAQLRTCRIGTDIYAFGWVRDSFDGLAEEMGHITKALSEFASWVRDAGGSYAVVYVPAKIRVLGSMCSFPAHSELAQVADHLNPLREYMRAWSERERIPMLDLTAPLQLAAQAGRIPWMTGDTHWNEVGHDVAAQSVAGWDTVKVLSPKPQ